MTALPYYKRYPTQFLRGIAHMSAEQIAVYTVLLESMYDAWQPIEDRTAKQRRDLARTCGLSVRKFGTVLDELIAADKLVRTASGRLSNRKFEQLARDQGIDFRGDYRVDNRWENMSHPKDQGLITVATPEKNAKKPVDNRIDNRADNRGALNDTKGLEGENGGLRARANIEHRTKNLDSTGPSAPLSIAAAEVIESEIQQICRAIGVDLRQDTKRAGWPHRWVRMRTEHRITVDDMVAAIATIMPSIRPDQVKSLGLFKDRAIEKRVARELDDQLLGVGKVHQVAQVATFTEREWFDRLALFLSLGAWSRVEAGPSPLQPGCLAPADLLDRAEAKWNAQGQHPESMYVGNHKAAWIAGKTPQLVNSPAPFAARAT